MYEKELEAVSHFSLDGAPVKIEPIICGNINSTFKVTLDNGHNYVLQNVNANVFKKPEELMANVAGVCSHLKKKLAATGGDAEHGVMNFATSDNGSLLYINDEGKYYRLYLFIEGVSYQSISRPELFYSAGEAFGNFQSLLADYPAQTLNETIVNFHNTVSRYKDFQAAVMGCKLPERLEESKEECLFFESREPLTHIAVDALKAGKMPLRVTHNDTKLNNVLIDPVTDKGVCVIDLDTVMPGSVLYDFGDAIRFGACTTAEDEPDTSKIAVDLDLFETFTRGFIAGLGGALTDEEYDHLADGALLMTYECGLRFLSDYLNGDTYFRITSEKHNLIRARAQIALLRDMEKKLPEMKRIIRECRA
ncbi:MAG: aminoglycoside phosphotransferase family protein [Clostridia bacterium]|nr:aminoglycoside phosphotransferase family protein [Clostridia bacterium]